MEAYPDRRIPASLAPPLVNGITLQRRVTITNKQGFHMRPATVFAQLAARFQSTVTVCKGDERFNGKSPLELMIVGAEQGTELTLETALEHDLVAALAAGMVGDTPRAQALAALTTPGARGESRI